MSTSITSVGKTPTRVSDLEKCVVIKCGNKTAEFYPGKLRKNGKSISKCIKHLGKWINPSEFECMAGMQHTRKWKQSIKVEGRPLGEWIDEHGQGTYIENTQQGAKKPENVLDVDLLCSDTGTGIAHNVSDSDNNVPGVESQSSDTSTCIIHNVSDSDNNAPGVYSQSSDTSTCTTYKVSVSDSDNNGLQNASAKVRQQPLSGEIPTLQCVANMTPDTIHSNFSSSLNSDLNQLLRDLETKLSASFRDLIDQAIQSLRSCIEEEVKSFTKQLEALSKRVLQLEEKVYAHSPQHVSEHAKMDPPKSKTGKSTYVQLVVQDQLSELQSQVHLLTSKQVQLEESNERERRKCNVLIGNLTEPVTESVSDLSGAVQKLLTDTLKVHCIPMQSLRIGKKEKGKNRLLLLKMAGFEEKLAILKAAKNLRGSGIFIKEDLSKSERSQRKVLVEKMMKARAEGKKAFIRFTDGKLIIEGKPSDFLLTSNSRNSSSYSNTQQ